MTAKRYVVSLGDDKNVLKLIVVMVVQLCIYNKTIELYTLNGRII